MDEPDVRLLAAEDLSEALFPGGRNDAFRVYFSPEVHAALWAHAGEDTSVEICGVLVGTWHRDEVGPFVKVVESIRGEGAQTKFAEVTFTHQTWAKINAEMDSKFAELKIVGWYHTHPDFGIFLSDRDRFIQEHFFSGPGQVAHVIDPVRRIEGVFIWRGGKPTPTEHFWVGDRILTGSETERTGGGAVPAAPSGSGESRGNPDALLPPAGRLIMFVGIFLMGFVLAMLYSSWERRRDVEAEVARNGVASVLRVGLSDELDRLRGDLAAVGRPLVAAEADPARAGPAFADARQQLDAAARRAAIIRERYANSPEVDDYLRRLILRERYGQGPDRGASPSKSKEPGDRPGDGAPAGSGKS